MPLKSPLQANQLLAGLQKREPRLYDLIRSIIQDLQEVTGEVNANTQAINNIINPPAGTPTGLTHGQVMKRIAGAT